jgi:hypothetical protein
VLTILLWKNYGHYKKWLLQDTEFPPVFQNF